MYLHYELLTLFSSDIDLSYFARFDSQLSIETYSKRERMEEGKRENVNLADHLPQTGE